MEYYAPKEFATLLATADTNACIDVRTKEEYIQGHIKGVRNVPLQEIAQRIAEFKETPVVYLHCKSGARALASAQLLSLHYPTVRVITLDGGFDAWVKEGMPVL